MPPRAKCGNPIFLGWVEDEKRIAQDKGSKAAETYGKAAKSISACPVPYNHPRELIALNGVGPKIVELLTRKWRIYCEENDMEMPATPSKMRKPRANAKKSTASQRQDDDEEEEEDEPPTPAKAKRKSAAVKTYIPQPRSGGYGLLLGLLSVIDDPTHTTTVYLNKVDLIRAAQPYCDASYSHPEKGSLYTAWASNKTLNERGYIYFRGTPAKYCLTEDGYNVACQMRALLPGFEDAEVHPWIEDITPTLALAMTSGNRSKPPPREIPLRPESSQQAAARSRPSLDINRRESNPGRFQFWYIDRMDQRVPSLAEATIRLDPDEYTNMRKIEFRHTQRTHPFARQLKLVDAESRVRDNSGLPSYFGFITEEGAPPSCSKFEDAPPPDSADRPSARAGGASAAASGSGAKRRRSGSLSDDELDVEGAPPRPRPKKSSNELFAEIAGSSSTFSRTHSAPVHINSAETARLAADAAARRMGIPAPTASLPSIPTPAKAIRPLPRLSSHLPVNNPLDDSEEAFDVPDFGPCQATVWPAGSYDILLIVDNREVESKDRDKFRSSLEAKGVRVETRPLAVGDFTWIARRRDGLGGMEDECVLDYVAERKRLDDLMSSIKDGRYNEQCHRLKNSAIQHVYYIVEEFQTAARMEVSGEAIRTAKSQIQVINKFFLKETHKTSETIDFLKIMTDVIISLHAHTDLRIIPTRFLSRPTFCALQKKLRASASTGKESSFLITYSDFQALNNKTSSQTLKEKYARMMMTTKSMSAEKCSTLLDLWDTPMAMWEDLARHNAAPDPEPELGKDGKPKKTKVRGRDMFFSDHVPGEGRRKIKDALSRDLYRNLMGISD